MARAAAYQATFPQASLRKIAGVVGVDHTVVKDWQRQVAYKREMVKWLIVCKRRSKNPSPKRPDRPVAPE
jgi:hypothetical protein